MGVRGPATPSTSIHRKLDTAFIAGLMATQTFFLGCRALVAPCPGAQYPHRRAQFQHGATVGNGPLSHFARDTLRRPQAEADGADWGNGERLLRRRRPRGKGLRRDSSGLPTEKVYAPRQLQYPVPKVGGSKGTKRIRSQGEQRVEAANNPAKLRVAGGSARGRKLESPDVFLRPMMGKVKEALFSTLTGFGVFEDKACRFLDLFSGSGSVGVEALSRGAGHVTFVDLARDCCEVSLRNAKRCDFEGQAGAVCADVLDTLYNPRKHGLTKAFDVVTVTPPYEEVVYADLIKALSQSDLVKEDTVVVIEYPVELGCMPHAIGGGKLVGVRNRRYGRTVLGVWVHRPSGALFAADSRPEEFVSLKK